MDELDEVLFQVILYSYVIETSSQEVHNHIFCEVCWDCITTTTNYFLFKIGHNIF